MKLFHNLPILKKFNKISKQQSIQNTSKQGSISLVKWFIEYLNCPTKTICELSAKAGHLHLFQWSRSNGCPWNEDICCNAVFNGYLQVHKWSLEIGAPTNKKDRKRYEEMLKRSQIDNIAAENKTQKNRTTIVVRPRGQNDQFSRLMLRRPMTATTTAMTEPKSSVARI